MQAFQRRTSRSAWGFLIGLAAVTILSGLPAISQQAENGFFPQEDFILINPTLPNDKLNFGEDSQESCCAKDYTPSGQPIQVNGDSGPAAETKKTVAKSEFEKDNPRYIENSTPSFLISCDNFADLPVQASNMTPAPQFGARSNRNNLPITSYSSNVSARAGAEYFTDPAMRNTSDFHIQTGGGSGIVRLQDVHSYSVCMGRGNNVAMVANTDNASILTYNGQDRVYLAGNNTNMLTRTGAGEDVIELHQARTNDMPGTTWAAYNIYKTALSGGTGTDTLILKATPPGTKWCHIGGYRIYGEYFHVVEFALPPSVTDGPRRQRVNIGHSIEYVVIKGRTYKLQEFLAHGTPMDTMAESVPIGDPLPFVSNGATRRHGAS